MCFFKREKKLVENILSYRYGKMANSYLKWCSDNNNKSQGFVIRGEVCHLHLCGISNSNLVTLYVENFFFVQIISGSFIWVAEYRAVSQGSHLILASLSLLRTAAGLASNSNPAVPK